MRKEVGLNDINGIAICEGDICKSGKISRKDNQYSVYWCDEKQWYSLGWRKMQGKLEVFQPLTIVGNIYDGVTRFDDSNWLLGYPPHQEV